jgi:hypothetical protein
MELTVDLILLAIAFICFLFVAAGISFGRINPLGVGLAAWVLAAIIP